MGDSSNKYEDSDWLRGQYVDERRSAPDIAKELGCSSSTIGRWLKIHGVEMRTGAETKITEQTRKLRNEEWLREQYVSKRRTRSDIGEELDVNAGTVGDWLKRHGIPRRSNSASQHSAFVAERLQDNDWLRNEYVEKQRSTEAIAEELDISSTTVGKWLKKHGMDTREGGRIIPETAKERLRDKEWLHNEYVEKRCTTTEIASQLKCSNGTVSNWLEKHDIEDRSTRENKLSERAARLVDDTEWLREEYITKRKTLAQIADDLGVTQRGVGLRLDYHGFERRTAGESRLSARALEYLQDSDWLREQYVQNERKSVDIAQEVGCADSTVRDWLRKYDVELRDISNIRAEGDIEKLRDEDWLRTQYLQKEKSALEIAELTGMSQHAVGDYLEKHGVEIRSSAEHIARLGHKVRSSWELAVANLLDQADIDYDYEAMSFEYGDDGLYTPDFATRHYVIEVKGRIYGPEKKKARAAMDQLKRREYVVVGAELPCDIHIPWEKRESLLDLFDTEPA